jgi:hypothetical protein
MWETFDAAVELAEVERSRLTLAKTCELGHSYVWVAPFCAAGVYVPPMIESPEEAGRIVARAAEFVPEWIPVTTLVLGPETGRELRRLVRCGHYEAVVAPKFLLSRRHLLARDLRRQGIRAVPMPECRPEARRTGPSRIVRPEQLTGVPH